LAKVRLMKFLLAPESTRKVAGVPLTQALKVSRRWELSPAAAEFKDRIEVEGRSGSVVGGLGVR
jgi:hypothetical protein